MKHNGTFKDVCAIYSFLLSILLFCLFQVNIFIQFFVHIKFSSKIKEGKGNISFKNPKATKENMLTLKKFSHRLLPFQISSFNPRN